MTIKVISSESLFDSKFIYHNQDVTNNFEIEENKINIWVCDSPNLLLPFTFTTFQILNDQDIEEFRKYIKSIKTGVYIAIIITGTLPYHTKRLYKTFQKFGGGKLIQQISESNPNYCLIGYKGQRVGFAKEIIGDSGDFDDDESIQVWTMTNKDRNNFKGRFIINIRNKTPFYKSISDFYKIKVKKEMIKKWL